MPRLIWQTVMVNEAPPARRRLRLSITPQTVKIRFWAGFAAAVKQKGQMLGYYKKKKALSGDFDFPRKRKPTVPMYADGLRLLAFGAF